MKNFYILTINPGSTSTKTAIFLDEKKIADETFTHSIEGLSKYDSIMNQADFRIKLIRNFIKKNNFQISKLSAVVGRGGLLTSMRSGTYLVNKEMIDFLRSNIFEHASNLGASLAEEISKEAGINAYIVDPIVVDEMTDVAKITGIPEIKRVSIFHALNQKAAAREAAKRINKKYKDCNFIVAHLGGGITIGIHKKGLVEDVNNGLNGDGPFSPGRSGSIPTWSLIEWSTSGLYSLPELKKRITGKGGVVAHLGTNDLREVKKMIEAGNKKAKIIYEALIYNIAKQIGSLAPVAAGKIDAVVITGGLAFDPGITDKIKKMVEFIAPVLILPGEDEMAALASGALRVLRGEEDAKIWKNKEKKNE